MYHKGLSGRTRFQGTAVASWCTLTFWQLGMVLTGHGRSFFLREQCHPSVLDVVVTSLQPVSVRRADGDRISFQEACWFVMTGPLLKRLN